MSTQKLSQLFHKANNLKLPKIKSQSQKKQFENKYTHFLTYQQEQIALLRKQTQSISIKLKQIESQPLNTNLKKHNRSHIENIEEQQELQLTNSLVGIFQEIEEDQAYALEARMRNLNELHLKNLKELDDKVKIIQEIQRKIYDEKKSIETISQSHRKQANEILDRILLKQQIELSEIDQIQTRCQQMLKNTENQLLTKINKWKQKNKSKRNQILKGLEKILQGIEFQS